MEIALNFSKTIYYLVRVCLVLFGALMVMGGVAGFLYPDILHSSSHRTARQDALIDAAFIVYGSLLLSPFRWLSRRYAFPVAMVVFGADVLWMLFAGVASGMGAVQGRKSFVALPAAVIYVALALVAPVTLIMRRRMRSKLLIEVP